MPDANGQHRLKSGELLIGQRADLAHIFAGNGEDAFGILIQLLLGIGKMDDGENDEHHSLIPGGEIAKKLSGFLALLFQIKRNQCGKIGVLCLPMLPTGNIALNGKELVLRLAQCLLGSFGNNINGYHHVSGDVADFCYHTVPEIGGVFPQVEYSSYFAIHFKIVPFEGHGIGGDGILKAMPLFCSSVDGIQHGRLMIWA